MTKEQIAARVRALLEEKAGYEARGMEERAWQVELQLRELGSGAEAPHKRSERR